MNKDRMCDNPKCELFHGNNEKLWLHQPGNKESDQDLDLYNVLYIGRAQVTLCRTCELAVDLVNYHRKNSK